MYRIVAYDLHQLRRIIFEGHLLTIMNLEKVLL